MRRRIALSDQTSRLEPVIVGFGAARLNYLAAPHSAAEISRTRASTPVVDHLFVPWRPHLKWHGDSVSLPTVISVNCAPDGKLLSAAIVKSSGNVAWDAAALDAVQLSDPMPAYENGKAMEHFEITFYQQGIVRQPNGNLY